MTTPVTVTGTYRSGTTLVERMLDQHPAAAILSQPLPHLWLAAKRDFLASRGVERAFPLGTLFRDDMHDPEALAAFLRTWPDDPTGVLREVAESQRGFSGAMTPEVDRLPGRVPAELTGGMQALVAWCHAQLARAIGRGGAVLVGAKEIVIDEFVPVLLGWGDHVVLVIRDLRSVLASSVHGSAERHVGSARPTLFTVRSWRRTVAMALAFRDHPNCHVLRYEDVLDHPAAIAGVWRSCGLEAPEGVGPDTAALEDQYGQPWSANTSFDARASGGADSMTRALDILDPATVAYANAAAGPELLACGYLDRLPDDPQRALRRFREPVPVTRQGLDAQLSTTPRELDAELQRLELLRGPGLDSASVREWFLLDGAYAALRDAVGGGPVLVD